MSHNSTKTTVSRLSRYPEPKSPLQREVHAPCTSRKFPLSTNSTTQYSNSFHKVVDIGDDKNNSLYINHQKARDDALASISLLKGKEVVEVDRGSHKVVVVEDGEHEGPSVVTCQKSRESDVVAVSQIHDDSDDKVIDGDNQQHLTPPVVSELNNSNLKMLDSLCLSPECGYSSVQAYKKLIEAVDNPTRRDTFERLSYEIQINEKRLEVLDLLRPKELVEEVPQELFVPLTKEEKAEVARAFSVKRKEVLVTHEKSNIEISVDKFRCLMPGAWLNDEVINLYLELLKERERRESQKFLKCHFFNTFFYKKLISGTNGYDFKSVRRWTSQKKLGYGLHECDKIFIPIHKQVHWCLAVINNKDKKFQYLDSLKGVDTQVMKVLAKYFVDEVKDKTGKDIDVSSWEKEFVEDLPEQKNGYDCGVFMIKYTDLYSRNLGLCFSQKDMPYFRLRTAKEILRLKAV
ncbi:PREDICTED: ubiquitin-like-specific protease ESD4 isoform X1 [Lupinus angustifolius]|uniref:ubiquitin-like-specific protease ESD4 isoform X1 n=1 Tax=Lupinus angustifolius TaxID=3871 RepID=UPI00092F3EBF|nr:PREDICTED: ubiquitin-like-specific protease ESD4 isoform X1 [Lupinus angustifolius]